MQDDRTIPGLWRLRFACGFMLMALVCLILPRRQVAEGVGYISERFRRFQGYTA